MPSIRSALGAGLIAIAVLLAPMGFTPTGGVSIGAGATVAAADGGPKVVIIVGPAGSASDSYREDAEAAAAEARRWTANVVTIFTPNATWDAVRPALQGAAIVVDMGHGNGFPSPYATTLQPETQDGLGLNPPGATENNTTRYYGEAVLAREVRLAPSAVVILSHLCYSSGNSEPGQPDPSPEVARQRVDNFAAGWFAAGARAVIADAHFGSSAAYIATFFGSQQPVESAWRSVPGANANEQAFSSVRTPGATGYLDPDPATGSYYRSLVVFPGLTTGDISGSFAPAQPLGPGPGGALLAYALSGGGAFSPNGDGRQDTIAVAGRLTGPAVWQLTFRGPGGVPAVTYGGTGDAFAASWDGTSAGIRVPDGGYGWDLTATDGWGNAGYVMGSVIVDTVAPAMAPPQKPGATTVFSPNGDRVADVLRLQLIASGANAFEAAVQDASGFPVRSLRVMAPAGTGELVWDGLTDAGGVAPDGRYSLSVTPLDEAGNAAPATQVAVAVFSALSAVRSSTTVFQPAGRFAPTARLSFTLLRPVSVTWTVTDAANRVVRTLQASTPMGPGAYSLDWDGRSDAGVPLPRGLYYAVVRATDGSLSAAIRASVAIDDFRIVSSSAAPARGGTITVTVTSAEPLKSTPALTVAQPGLAASKAKLTRLANGTYRATVRLSAAGAPGTLRLRVAGRDADGGRNESTLALPLR